MKSVILEIKNGYASVLSDDGCIRKIKNKDYEVGQTININIVTKSTIKKISIRAASAAAIFVLSIGSWAYASPYSYVSLDINPSIEFILNRFDRVLKLQAGNEESEDILQELHPEAIRNKTITNAINLTLSQISELGYLSDETTSGIVIAASNKSTKKADELVKEIKMDVEDDIIDSYETASVEIFSVDLEGVEKAKELGVTPGKLNLVEKLIESSDNPQSVIIEDWINKPVKDIMEATKENKSADNEAGPSPKGPKDKKNNINDDKTPSDNNIKKPNKKALKEDKKASRNTEKAAREAEREAKKVAREAEKEAKKPKPHNNKDNSKNDGKSKDSRTNNKENKPGNKKGPHK